MTLIINVSVEIGKDDIADIRGLQRSWRGGANNPSRVRVVRFLLDLEESCLQIATLLKQRARAVFVVSRRKPAYFFFAAVNFAHLAR
jgi:hypothetical protein